MCVMTIEGWKIVADVIGHVVWPLLVAIVLIRFHKPLYKFLSEADEAAWGGASVKRGNKESKQLRSMVEDTVGEVVEGNSPVVDESDDSKGSDQHDSLNLQAETDLRVDDIQTGVDTGGTARLAADRAATLRYYGRVAENRLVNSKYNTSTSSARLGAELVGNSYADLKQAVRMVAFVAQGVGGTRGRLPALLGTLDGLILPRELDADIRKARAFAEDVTAGSLRVDGQGASDYIDSVRVLVNQLIAWGVSSIERND
jgi:hypothetical protein